MEVLVSMRIVIPHDMPESDRAGLYAQEARIAQGYIRDGQLKRIWRVPGSRANWMLWEITDATELHTLLSGFPLFGLCRDIDVHFLADNANDPVIAERNRAREALGRGPYSPDGILAMTGRFPVGTMFRLEGRPACGIWTAEEINLRAWEPGDRFIVEPD